MCVGYILTDSHRRLRRADAAQCQCVYIGNEASYQNYQQIRIAKNIADEQQASAEMNQEAMMDWNAWGPGPWMPGFY